MKRIVAVCLSLLMAFSCFNACAPTEEISWETLVLGSILPAPPSKSIDIVTDDETRLSAYVHNISETQFREYIGMCKDAGFAAEDEDAESTAFYSYNQDGYYLSLSYRSADSDMYIGLSAPEKLSQFQWPEIASVLPVPASDLGRFSQISENGFELLVGNTTFPDYQAYVAACIEKGFTVEQTTSQTSYAALNAEGCYVSVTYKDFNTMTVMFELIKGALSDPMQDMPEFDATQDALDPDATQGTSKPGTGTSTTPGTTGNSTKPVKITVTMDEKAFLGMSRTDAEKRLKDMGFTVFKYEALETDDTSKTDNTVGAVEIKATASSSGDFSKGDTFDSNATVVLWYYMHKGATPEPDKGLQLGYTKESITPKQNVPLGGHGNAETRYPPMFWTSCMPPVSP